MNIQQFTRVMQQKKAQRVIIATNEPLLIFITDKWHKSTTVTPTGTIIDRMLRDCIPSDLLNKLFNDDSFSFPHKDSNGHFEIEISGTAAKRSVIITDKTASAGTIPAPLSTSSSNSAITATPSPGSSAQIVREMNKGNVNIVAPAASADSPVTKTSAPAPQSAVQPNVVPPNIPNVQWYHNANGQRLGPISQAAMKQNIHANIVRPETLVWRTGMADWQMAKLTELGHFFQSPPMAGNTYGTPPAAYGNIMGNTSGQGESAEVPAELQNGFNWGAFLLAPFWAAAHNLWVWAIVIFVTGFFFSILNLIPAVILAAQANKLGWQNRRWNNVAHFKEVQKIWQNWGIGFLLVFIVPLLILTWVIIAAVIGASM